MKKLTFVLFAFCLLLSACSSIKEEPNKSAEDLYNEGYKLLEKTSYKKSSEAFEQLELEHPYSKWATKAKLMGAYAYYKDQKYDDAILSLDRFIKFHPGNKDIAYAYYLKALCYYNQITAVDREQSNTELALDALKQVIARFPDSEYAVDASLKIDLAKDHLAGKEMEVGRFYLNQKNQLSALNRFSVVVNNYQTTTHIEEALYRQAAIYKSLGLNKESQDAIKVLGFNYPNSKWYKLASELEKK